MENRINHIIARVLSGESSSDDILSLSEWLNENEKNRDEFRRLKNYWDADVAFKHSVAPAFSADKLQQKINVQRRQTARRQLWRNAIPLIAAACLLFIFSTALFLYNTNDRISERKLSYPTCTLKNNAYEKTLMLKVALRPTLSEQGHTMKQVNY